MEMVILIVGAVAALVAIERQKESMNRMLRAKARTDRRLPRRSGR